MAKASAAPSAGARIYTVSEVNGLIHDLLENSLPEIWMEGEVSNCKLYPSGHTYLTLKDEEAQIRAVLFKGAALGLKFKPEDGLKVLVRGRASSYVKRGDLQFVVSWMEPREKGALQLAFEQLKARLAAEGLFDESRKKPLPAFPSCVGVVTSGQGAAVHDMISVLGRRWPLARVLIYPVKVQGEGAAEEIAGAVRDFNEFFPETDVLLVGRGGGSMEDLWAFNEETAARAVAESKIPVVSCVGHETDFTIADFVADQRAPTPSAAAELAAPDRRAVLGQIESREQELAAALREKIQVLSERLSRAASHPLLQSPERIYEDRTRFLDDLWMRLEDGAAQALLRAKQALAMGAAKLEAYSPLKVLGRGYAIAEKLPHLEIIRSAGQVRPGDRLRLRLAEGRIECEVAMTEGNGLPPKDIGGKP
ncbi:MAG TPA: exodeoxyribonuclease VII large subunit [Elusimicrobiota bacterium]|nr:exodeoxyribonuclease VII large subunit [Elusimicrobiota bacterium]